MPKRVQSKRNKWSLGALMIGSLLAGQPAVGHYDPNCLGLLTQTTRQVEAFRTWRRFWADGIEHSLKLGRPLSDVEFEALMDMMHDLPVIVEFEGGHIDQFSSESNALVRFRVWLRAFQILKVTYEPETLVRLGWLYKTACEKLNRRDCDTYNFYRGWSEPTKRPFTPLQERALKWTTFHMMPQRSLIQWYRNSSAPTDQVEKALVRNEMERKAAAIDILMSSFNDNEGVKLYLELIEPMIHVAYGRLFKLYLGELEH